MPELEDLFGTTEPATPEPVAPDTQSSAPPQQPPAPPAAPAAASPQEPSKPSTPTVALPSFATSGLYARAKSAGLDLDGIDSPDSFAEVLLDRYMAERPYADHGRSQLASQYKPEQSSVAPEKEQDGDGQFDLDGHFNSLWSVPQVSPEAKFLVDNGAVVQNPETGRWEAAPGCESLALPHLASINQFQAAHKQSLHSLFEGNFYQNIDKGLWPAIEHRVQNLLEQRLGQQIQTYHQEQQAQSFEQQFINDNKSWLHDANGRLTAKGEEFRQAVATLRERGMTDPKELAEWATLKIGGIPQTTQTPAEGQPTAGNGKPRDEHGRFLPAGTPAPGGPPKTKQESFIDSARRQAAASSNQSGTYSDAGGDAVVENDGELENMFTNEWKRHKGAAAAA